MYSICSLCVRKLGAASVGHCNPGKEIVEQSEQIVRKKLKKKIIID